MKSGNIQLITGVACFSAILNMISLLFTIDKVEAEQTAERCYRTGTDPIAGYRPVREECPDIEEIEVLKDNLLYREWCEEKFDNGAYIYEGYKDIAFNIKYEPEAVRCDNWQTPSETAGLRKGDCEDAVFLFFSHLPPYQKNAKIVWGWVIDNLTGIARAHVWYQLTDNEGCQYIVEGFSNDWNGIIPMEIVEHSETRKSILTITHPEASRLAGLIRRPDSLKTFRMIADLYGSKDFVEDNNKYYSKYDQASYHFNSEHISNHTMSREYKMSWAFSVRQRLNMAMSKEISKIFNKLHELFTRHENQMESLTADTHVDYQRENLHSGRNMICRR